MMRYTVTLPQHHNPDEASATLTSLFGGYTRTDGEGGWRSPTGNVIVEPVTVYTVDTDREDALDRLRAWAGWLAAKLHEEAVYLTASPVTAELIVPASPVNA